MSSRRYSLPSLRAGVRLPFRKAVQRDGQTTGSLLSRADSSIISMDSKVHHIKQVMNSVHPGHCRPLPGQAYLYQIFGNHRVNRLTTDIDCDECYPNIFIGNEGTAKNRSYLKLIGVTHVLNCADGGHFGQSCSKYRQTFYQADGIEYMGLNILDVPHACISLHFQEASDFIEKALATGGKVLVHCMAGLSRSATIVLAFLMIRRGHSLQDAGRRVRSRREVRPNDGFIKQLIELEQMLVMSPACAPLSSSSSPLVVSNAPVSGLCRGLVARM